MSAAREAQAVRALALLEPLLTDDQVGALAQVFPTPAGERRLELVTALLTSPAHFERALAPPVIDAGA